jgi:Cu-Zn family superoxide dismutase
MGHLIISRVAAALLGLTAALLLGTGALARPAAEEYPAYTLPGDRVFPEGVAYQASTGDFFAGSTTDGAILRGNVAQPAAELWLPGGTEGMTTTRGMKVDGKGRIFVASGPQRLMFVFDVRTKQLLAKLASDVQPSFINDVALTPNGDAYFTDSSSPMLYRVSDATGQWTIDKISLAGTAVVYQAGFNLGGIAASDDGKYLILAQGNTGQLYRFDIATRQATLIDIGSETMLGADGILLESTVLRVMRNADKLLVTLSLSDDYTRGTVTQVWTDPAFSFPTTMARAGAHILVTNSQFDKRNAGQPPSLPFQILSIPTPTAMPIGMPTTGAGDPFMPLLVAALAGILLLSGVALRGRRRAR